MRFDIFNSLRERERERERRVTTVTSVVAAVTSSDLFFVLSSTFIFVQKISFGTLLTAVI